MSRKQSLTPEDESNLRKRKKREDDPLGQSQMSKIQKYNEQNRCPPPPATPPPLNPPPPPTPLNQLPVDFRDWSCEDVSQ
jgi:hypothetical protein